MKNKKYCLLSIRATASRKSTLKLKLFQHGKRPDQRRNDPVGHEEVPVEPQEVVVEEDREVEQQQAAPGEEIVGDNEEIAEPIVAEEGQPRRSTQSHRKPDKFGQNIYDV